MNLKDKIAIVTGGIYAVDGGVSTSSIYSKWVFVKYAPYRT